MGSQSIELKIRVIVVTTRAALRHAEDDRDERLSVVERGLVLLDGLAAEALAANRELIARARAELEAMVDE